MADIEKSVNRENVKNESHAKAQSRKVPNLAA